MLIAAKRCKPRIIWEDLVMVTVLKKCEKVSLGISRPLEAKRGKQPSTFLIHWPMPYYIRI